MIKKISLREKKYAQTKKNILDAFLNQLKTKSVEDVSIRELCREVQISEGTFFNYFSHKYELLVYFIHLWSIEASWQANQTLSEAGPLKAIEKVFTFTADQMKDNHQIMNEIIAFLARECRHYQPQAISQAEYQQYFGGKDQIESCSPHGLDDIFSPLLKKAIKAGELPKNLAEETVLLALRSIFFGVPISIKKNPEKIKKSYQELLKVLWQSFI